MKRPFIVISAVVAIAGLVYFLFFAGSAAQADVAIASRADTGTLPEQLAVNEVAADSTTVLTLDTVAYNAKMISMLNGDSSEKWPVKADYPLAGAILPFKTIIAFYGNLYSKQMGILGELPRKQMLEKLQGEMKRWKAADSTLDMQPALHYIAVTAQQNPGKGNKYRLRMPFHQIDSVLSMAKEIDAIVFLDIQVGLSDLRSEIPEFEKYLKMPNVHLGIDPEFSMKGGQAPGKVVGVYDAADVNYASDYLAKLVKDNNLPPKILIIHRFTQGMVTNYKQIKTRPEVQLIMHMDGWGEPARKVNTYKSFIYKEPVQFTGFKLFYKNDTKKSNSRLMTPEELLKLKPRPVYIQYQ
ncbi:MAG: hypothetical protein ABI687_11005 [Flavitalea sp.]